MKSINHIQSSFKKSEQLAKGSKWKRFCNHPFKYLLVVCFNKLLYKVFEKGLLLKTKTFWGDKMYVQLPVGTDIFLTGTKSDATEIRLSKFIMQNLKANDAFIDVGCHIGFYSRLASNCVGLGGKVLAIDASTKILKILKKNVERNKNIIAIQTFLSNKVDVRKFYEFPLLYSEYNTAYAEQFEMQPWFALDNINCIEVSTTTVDALIKQYNIQPSIIKIDAEGAEYEILQGAIKTLQQLNVIVTMEYLHPARKNENHQKAVAFMQSMGYTCFIIDGFGTLQPCYDANDYIISQQIESDNIVFKKLL